MLPEISWSSEDFDFATDVDVPLCRGTLPFQQRFVDLIQQIFGKPSDRRTFTFYLLSPGTFYDLIGFELRGLYNDGKIYAQGIPDLHEATHAVVDLAIGNSHPYFGEGVAEVFRDRFGADRSPGGAFEDGLEHDGLGEKFPGELYGRAGHFMSYALDVHGIEPAAALLSLARPGDSSEELKESLSIAFGLSYEDLIENYNEYPLCAHSAFRWPIAECDLGIGIDSHDDVWTVDAQFDCESGTALGTRVGKQWTVHTVEIPRAGAYLVSVTGEDSSSALIELGYCSAGCGNDKGVEVKVDESKIIDLRKGRYHITSVMHDHLTTRISPLDPSIWSNEEN